LNQTRPTPARPQRVPPSGIWYQRALSVRDRALDGVELLGEFRAGPAGFDHADHGGEVAVSALQALEDGGVRGVLVLHALYPTREDTSWLVRGRTTGLARPTASLGDDRHKRTPGLAAKLDQLSRDVAFIVAELGADANPFMLYIYAVLAEEGRLISARRHCRQRRPNSGLPSRGEVSGAPSLRAIAAELNQRGISTVRGGPWSTMQVRRVLGRC
jgi:hypothetical protein